MVTRTIDAPRAAVAGLFAGLTAGMILSLLMTVLSAAGGRDIWYGLKGAAAPFLGDRAMIPGFDPWAVTIGLFCHLGISMAWGVLFALLVYRWNTWATLLAGVAWGFVVWVGMYHVVLPLVGLASMREDAPVGRAIAFHLFFSVVLALCVILYRRLLAGADAAQPTHSGRLRRRRVPV